MGLGNYLRVALLGTACLAAVGSATSNQNTGTQPAPQYGAPVAANNTAPPPQQMDPGRAIGLWRSTFGAVKIEADNSHGGLQAGAVQGIWVYQRQGQEVIGYFSGNLRGNVMQFRWQEPNNPPLTGEGYLVFEQTGRQYSGRWWTDHKDRVGDWNGWREQQQPQPQQFGQQEYPQGQYGGAQYGYQTPPPPPAYAPAPRQAPPQPYAPPPYQQPRQPRQPQYPTYPAQPAPPPPPPSQNPYY